MASNFSQSADYRERPEMKTNGSPQLRIIKPPINNIVEKGNMATFQCTIEGELKPIFKWFKDGILIKPSSKQVITTDGPNTRLDIVSVVKENEGLYVIIASNKKVAVCATATLHMAPNFDETVGAIYIKPKYEETHQEQSQKSTLNLVRNLRPVCICANENIELEFIINGKIKKIDWYKNNILLRDVPIKGILGTSNKKLTIASASRQDSGIYTVLIYTDNGIAVSSTEAVVTDKTKVPIQLFLESKEIFPKLKKVNVFGEFRIICRMKLVKNSEISWSTGGDPYKVITDKNILSDDYGYGYVGLTFLKPELKGCSKEYSLRVNNNEATTSDQTHCTVNEYERPEIYDNMAPIPVYSQLMSVVACVGAKVVFDVTFGVPDKGLIYTVWYIGRHRVERTSESFTVLTRRGISLLYIDEVHRGMAGEVKCLLQLILAGQRPVTVGSSCAHLSVVPSYVVDEELRRQPLYSRGFLQKIRSEANFRKHHKKKYNLYSSDVNSQLSYAELQNIPGPSRNANVGTNDLLSIVFSRFHDGFMFLQTELNGKTSSKELMVYEEKAETAALPSNYFVFDWVSAERRVNTWFIVKLELTTGELIEVGRSSRPRFRVYDVVSDHLILLQISTVDGQSPSEDRTISFVHSPYEAPKGDAEDIKVIRVYRRLYQKITNTVGSFGKVSLVKNRRGKIFAAKPIATPIPKKRSDALIEYQIMLMLEHPHIVPLLDAFDAKTYFMLVMEYSWGGDLLDRIMENDTTERNVVCYMKQICEALQYMHSMCIAHLDLKPENIICVNPNSHQIKIINFGLARMLDKMYPTKLLYASVDYASPEVLNEEHVTLASDMWTVGVVTYVLLSGLWPFPSYTCPYCLKRTQLCKYNFNDESFKVVSSLAKDFIAKLLVWDPQERMTSAVALKHAWIEQGPPDGSNCSTMMKTRANMMKALKKHRTSRRVSSCFY